MSMCMSMYPHTSFQPWNISRSDCPELELRTSFAGDYNQYQCGLRVDAARTRDSGSWSCEMVS